MLPSRPSPLRHSHPCLSPTYTRSVFEGRFELLRPSVRGTPSPTTHIEGLLLRVGTLSYAPTYSRGVVQHVVFNRFGLAQPHEYSSKAAACYASSAAQAASNGSNNNMYRGRKKLLLDARCKSYRFVPGTYLHLSRQAILERVPTD